jgi:hypothetical protein
MILDASDLKLPVSCHTAVKTCARCGGNHREILFRKFKQPIQADKVWTHWGICPKTHEPILMLFSKDSTMTISSKVKKGELYDKIRLRKVKA